MDSQLHQQQLADTVDRHESHLNQISLQLSAITESLTLLLTDQHSTKKSVVELKKQMQDQNPPLSVNYRTLPNLQVDLSRFSGKDPDYWVEEAEDYCKFYLQPLNTAMRLASLTFEGEALEWHNKRLRSKPLSSWEDFKADLYAEFGSPEVKDPEATLCKLEQTGSLKEYYSKFIRCVSHIKGLPEKFLLKVYINGLTENIRCLVKQDKPEDVEEAYLLARDYERKLSFLYQPGIALKTLNPRLMRVTGYLGGDRVNVVIGNLSSYNFIQPWVVRTANCSTVLETRLRALRLGAEGEEVDCVKKCLNLPLLLNLHEFCSDYYVRRAWGFDIMLGAQWLESLDDIKVSPGIMEYVCDGVTHQLKWRTVTNSESIIDSLTDVVGVFK